MPWTLRMTLMIGLASTLFHWYVARKMIRALTALTGWPKPVIRIVGSIAVVIGLLYPLTLAASYLLNGRIVQKSGLLFDILLLYPFWIGIVIVVQLTFLFVGLDLIGVLLSRLYKSARERLPSLRPKIVVVLACLCTIYVVGRVYADTFGIRTRNTELRLSTLPGGIEPLRIVHIADLQVDEHTNGRKLQAFIDEVNRLEPDLIFFCGDLVTSGTEYINHAAEAMGKMKSHHGTFACLGDHDFFSNREMVAKSLAANGIRVLDDANELLDVNGTKLSITGVTNVYRRRTDAAAVRSLANSRPEASLNILIAHQPSPWLVELGASLKYDLFLAGHTHGGQIVFPLPGFWLAGSRLETPYVSGFNRVGNMLVSTTNGLGLTLAPIRYHAPAEITFIVINGAGS